LLALPLKLAGVVGGSRVHYHSISTLRRASLAVKMYACIHGQIRAKISASVHEKDVDDSHFLIDLFHFCGWRGSQP
jgi:hypothetical protein